MHAEQEQPVVVGGGILGASVGLHLADRGLRPVLLDPRTSGPVRAYGSIGALEQEPLPAYELACAGMGEWRRFAARLGGRVGYRRSGTIRWADDPAEAATLVELVRRGQRRGYPVRMIGEAELRRRLPRARPRAVLAAAVADADGEVEPDQVVAASRAAVAAAGGRLLLGRPARLRVDDDGVLVEVGDTLLRPAVTVLAAGADSAAVAAATGLEIPTAASPGLLVTTEPIAPLLDGVIYAPGRPPVHLRQRPDGSVLLGERSQETVTAHPPGRRARRLLDQAGHAFPALAGVRIEHVTVGWRPLPSDHLPLVGPVPGLPGLYLAVAPGALTAAPALGRVASQPARPRRCSSWRRCSRVPAADKATARWGLEGAAPAVPRMAARASTVPAYVLTALALADRSRRLRQRGEVRLIATCRGRR
jgi:glycine/D-amino acid oxidase-like deaminating enzyme